jgi:hypothetical protein
MFQARLRARFCLQNPLFFFFSTFLFTSERWGMMMIARLVLVWMDGIGIGIPFLFGKPG